MTLHWGIRELMAEMRQDGRLAVLIELWSRANVRNRCWPGTDLIVRDTGWGAESVVAARQWLLQHGAIVLVPYDKRIDEERDLPIRQMVYQLTGVVRLDNGDKKPYLHLNPEGWASISAAVDNLLPSEILVGEISVGRTKGITSIEGNTIEEDISRADPSASAVTQRRTTNGSVKPAASSGEEVRTEDNAKQIRIYSALERRLDQVLKGAKTSKADGERLRRPIITAQNGEQDSPAILYDRDGTFRIWVESKIDYFQTLDKDGIAGRKILIALVTNYDEPKHGWLNYRYARYLEAEAEKVAKASDPLRNAESAPKKAEEPVPSLDEQLAELGKEEL